MPRPKPAGQDDIDNRFAFHPANDTTGPQHDEVRTQARNLASKWNKALPAGLHKSKAITALQEAMMWANASIACDSNVTALPTPEQIDAGDDADEPTAAAPAKRAPRKAAAKQTASVTSIRRPRAQRASQG